jgi:hypothetical protein
LSGPYGYFRALQRDSDIEKIAFSFKNEPKTGHLSSEKWIIEWIKSSSNLDAIALKTAGFFLSIWNIIILLANLALSRLYKIILFPVKPIYRHWEIQWLSPKLKIETSSLKLFASICAGEVLGELIPWAFFRDDRVDRFSNILQVARNHTGIVLRCFVFVVHSVSVICS